MVTNNLLNVFIQYPLRSSIPVFFQIYGHVMNQPKKSMLLILTIIATFMTSSAYAADIEAAIDRNPVSINDSFQLTFTSADEPDDDPDFSPLEQDFEILTQQQSKSSSWVNGRFSKNTQWTLSLMARRSGILMIPSIAFGNDISQPLTIRVTQSHSKNTIDDELFLEVEVTPEQPYVQTQVLYSLRFYRRVQISKASLNEPELENSVIEKLGEDSNYTTRINGVPYAVTERKYAIFPQQSGTVTIAPLSLTAEVIDDHQPRFNGFFSSRRSRTRRISSRSISLDVQPVPKEYTATHWLGAEQVYIEEKWSDDSRQVKVGEPLTRTLTLLAKGITVSQLPELNGLSSNERIKTYPDQPVLKEKKNAEGLVSFREEKIAYIPSQPGEFVLPAIEIPWFNTQTRLIETARLPEVTIKAVATQPAVTKKPPSTANPNKMKIPQPDSPVPQSRASFWFWLSCFLGTGWLVTLLFLLRKRSEKKTKKKENTIQQSLKNTQRRLKKACLNNDPHRAKEVLLEWGRRCFNASTLGDIAPHCEARLRDQIYELNQCLYSAEQCQWQGKKLFQAFVENTARRQIKPSKFDGLEPLYPDTQQNP